MIEMVDMVCEVQTAQGTLTAKVLDTLRTTPLRPTDLMQSLRGAATPREIQNALSDLVEAGAVVFGTDRLLRVTSIAA